MTSRCSSFLAIDRKLKCAKVCVCVHRHSLCMLPIHTVIFLLIQLFIISYKIYLQLQHKSAKIQHPFFTSLLALSFSLSGSTSSLISEIISCMW